MAGYYNSSNSRPFEVTNPEVDDGSSRNRDGPEVLIGSLSGIGLSTVPQPSGKENKNARHGIVAAPQSTQPTQQLAMPEIKIINHDGRGEDFRDGGVDTREANAVETLSLLRSGLLQGPIDPDRLSVPGQAVEADTDTTAQGGCWCECVESFGYPLERMTSRRPSSPPTPAEAIPARRCSDPPPNYEEATATAALAPTYSITTTTAAAAIPTPTLTPATTQFAGSGNLFAPVILVRIPCVRSPLAGTIHFYPLFQWNTCPPPPCNLLKKIREREGAVVFRLHPTNLIHTKNYVGSDRMGYILNDVEKQLVDIYDPWYLGWEDEYSSRRNCGTWVAEWTDPISEVTEPAFSLLLVYITEGTGGY